MSLNTTHILTPRPYPSLLSIVIPVYNEEPAVAFLRAEITAFLPRILCPVEVILVNDGSRDDTLPLLLQWANDDPRVKILHLSRNFGHQIAATAGLDFASGDAIVLIDADLQDPLPVILQMIDRYREGYDVVYGQREVRHGESPFKRFTAWLFYRLMRRFVHPDLPVDAGDFRLIARDCLLALQRMRETHRFLRGMVAWLGFSQIAVPYVRHARVAGETKYPLRKMLQFAWTAAISFSTLPLRFSLFLGFLAGLFAVEESLRAVVAWFRGETVVGWTSLMVVISAIGSAMLLSIGIVGEYVGRIYEQSKARPLYVVARAVNLPGGLPAAVIAPSDPSPRP